MTQSDKPKRVTAIFSKAHQRTDQQHSPQRPIGFNRTKPNRIQRESRAADSQETRTQTCKLVARIIQEPHINHSNNTRDCPMSSEDWI